MIDLTFLQTLATKYAKNPLTYAAFVLGLGVLAWFLHS